MKKFLSLAMATAMALTMAACGSAASSSAATSTASGATESDASSVQLTPAQQQVSEYNGDYTTFKPADGITDDGMWDVNTADFITITDEYKNIKFPKDISTVSEEEYQTQLNSVIENYTTTEQVKDRAVEDGDTVNIDYVGSVDGVEFDGGSTQGNGTDVTIGVTSYIDDFLEQIIGHKPGETFDVNVTFPDEYPNNTSLQSKDAVFVVTVNYIEEIVKPDLTDNEWVKSYLGADSFEDYEKQLKTALVENQKANYIFDQLESTATFSDTLPDEMVLHEQNSMLSYYNNYAQQNGMDLDTFVSALGANDIPSLLAVNADDMILTIKDQLLVQAIAEDANITISDDDLKAYFTKAAGTDDYSQYEEAYGIGYIKNAALRDKVLNYIIENGTDEA